LANVIGRFKGIAWKTLPQSSKTDFEVELKNLSSALDRAQHRAAELDKRWLSLRQDDLVDQNGVPVAVEEWWPYALSCPERQSERVQVLIRSFEQTRQAMKEAEIPLRKWVVRHLRDSKFPDSNIVRRSRQIGRAISLEDTGDGGLPVEKDALLPFLLAARAQAVVGNGENAGHATFAEGLASSYEAFLETRKSVDKDEEVTSQSDTDERVNRYVKKLAAALPDEAAYAQHPKIAPVVARVLDLWRHREKVVVFCHYRETGRALVRHLSAALERQLWNDAAQRFKMDIQAVQKAVTDFGGRFDTEGGMRDPLNKELERRLAPYSELSAEEQELILDVVRRFVRTPLFVARYFDIHARSGEQTLQAALDARDMSGTSLSEKIDAFLKFITKRCSPRERKDYLDALNRMQPGMRGEAHRDKDDDLSQLAGASLMPNIRLANGLVRQETRQRLMLAFNTPFFPEVLVASSVLADRPQRGSAGVAGQGDRPSRLLRSDALLPERIAGRMRTCRGCDAARRRADARLEFVLRLAGAGTLLVDGGRFGAIDRRRHPALLAAAELAEIRPGRWALAGNPSSLGRPRNGALTGRRIETKAHDLEGPGLQAVRP
jgi:hypothetical protein